MDVGTLTQETMFWVEIDLGDEMKFSLQLKRPTFKDQTDDRTNQLLGVADFEEKRLRRCLMNWKGIIVHDKEGDEGHQLAFTFDALSRLCERFPSMYSLIQGEVDNLYQGLPERALGEPGTPSAASSPEIAPALSS